MDFEMIEAIRRAKGDNVADALISKVFYVNDMTTYYEDMKANKALFSNNWNDFNSLKAEMLSILESL